MSARYTQSPPGGMSGERNDVPSLATTLLGFTSWLWKCTGGPTYTASLEGLNWVELEVSEGIRFAMVAASIAVCGFEHGVRQISALGLTGHRHPCLPT